MTDLLHLINLAISDKFIGCFKIQKSRFIIQYNLIHIPSYNFCKEGFGIPCLVNKFAQDLKYDHDQFDSFLPR